jgi:hypothetical protein
VGVEAAEMPSSRFGARIDAEIRKWDKLVRPLKISVD